MTNTLPPSYRSLRTEKPVLFSPRTPPDSREGICPIEQQSSHIEESQDDRPIGIAFPAYMVRRAVPARVEDHVRGHAERPGGGDAGDRTAGHGGDGLPLPQYPCIQSEIAGRPLSEGRPAGGVAERPRRIDRGGESAASPRVRDW